MNDGQDTDQTLDEVILRIEQSKRALEEERDPNDPHSAIRIDGQVDGLDRAISIITEAKNE